MHMSEYQGKAMEFRLPSANAYYAQAGLAGEVGELLGYMAKCVRDDQVLQTETLVKELGDILWFVAAVADDFCIDLDHIAKKNIDKLSKRKEAGTIQGSGDNR
jgi:NTP pyrophosphatase (non-canonical NTP hydrolase)